MLIHKTFKIRLEKYGFTKYWNGNDKNINIKSNGLQIRKGIIS